MHHNRIIYRVAVDGLHCRSSAELVQLKVAAIGGVEAASVGMDHVLTVFAIADLVSAEDIVRTLIDAGTSPAGAVIVSPVESLEASYDELTFAAEERFAEEAAAEEAPEAVAATAPRASLMQRIHVGVSDAYYPDRIDVIPGVPVEIEFTEGQGCLARVLFEQFGIDADLTQGGAVVRLPGLAPGEYPFSCGMRMVHGAVVAVA